MRKVEKSRKGFSLVEVVIAIAIVTVLLTTFMAVFGPAQKSVSRALGVAEANRLVATLENEMGILREGEKSQYDVAGSSSAFEKAFQWVRDSASPTSAVVVFQYQAQPKSSNTDGTLRAAVLSDVNNDQKQPGVDYITQTVARRLDKADSSTLKAELSRGIVTGKVYAVRMTQLVRNQTSGALELSSNTAEIVNDDGSTAADSEAYEEGVITLQVEFFALNNNLHKYVTGKSWDFERLGKPVATQNIAVRR